jgi:hypothetical protein
MPAAGARPPPRPSSAAPLHVAADALPATISCLSPSSSPLAGDAKKRRPNGERSLVVDSRLGRRKGGMAAAAAEDERGGAGVDPVGGGAMGTSMCCARRAKFL